MPEAAARREAIGSDDGRVVVELGCNAVLERLYPDIQAAPLSLRRDRSRERLRGYLEIDDDRAATAVTRSRTNSTHCRRCSSVPASGGLG